MTKYGKLLEERMSSRKLTVVEDGVGMFRISIFSERRGFRRVVVQKKNTKRLAIQKTILFQALSRIY